MNFDSKIDDLARQAASLRGFDNFNSLVEVCSGQLTNSACEIEELVKKLTAKVMEMPIGVFTEERKGDLDYLGALTGVLFSVPNQSVIGGSSDEERVDLVAAWVDSCFPAGTLESMRRTMLSEKQLAKLAQDYELAVPTYSRVSRQWYQIACLHNVLNDVFYYYHIDDGADSVA